MKWSTGPLGACKGVSSGVEMPESRCLKSGPGDEELYKPYTDLLNLFSGANGHLFTGVK